MTHIERYTEDWVTAVKSLNNRFRNSGASASFPEKHVSTWLPDNLNRKIYQEHFLAVDNEVAVGGYILKHQEFSFYGKMKSIAANQLPTSEGIIDNRYKIVGPLVLADAIKRQPLLFALGIGGYNEPYAKALTTLGWKTYTVPFYFKVINSSRFFKNVTYLRTIKVIAVVSDILAVTGFGWATINLIQSIFELTGIRKSRSESELVDRFTGWAGKLWDKTNGRYSMIGSRDSETLNILYPEKDTRFIRLKITRKNKAIGWVVVLDTNMKNHKFFGNMRVGSIIDGLALPEDAINVVDEATRFLESRNVDIVVSNQSHHAWCSALTKCGFIKGPSNYIYAASKELTSLLEPFDKNIKHSYFNRGDGDGPINL